MLKYALLLFLALAGLKFLEFQFFSYRLELDIYLGLVALFFLLLGLWLAHYYLRHKLTDSGSANVPDSLAQERFSQRELDILLFLAQGYTNKEIAQGLSISPNTVKTHLSNIFSKLEVSNRTQAVAEAKLLKVID